MSHKGKKGQASGENDHFSTGHVTHNVAQHHFFQEQFGREDRDRTVFRKRGPPAIDRNPLLPDELATERPHGGSTSRTESTRRTPRSARTVVSTARSTTSTYLDEDTVAALNARKASLLKQIADLDKKLIGKKPHMRTTAERPLATYPTTYRGAMKTTSQIAYS